jgi:D-aminopeptidase
MNRKERVALETKFKIGKFQRGEKNSITDIKGVKVGHFTVNKNIQEASEKKGIIRTGITAVLPYPMEKEIRLFSQLFTLRGKNEITGYEVTDDFCYLNSPLVFSNAYNVGGVYNAILSYGFSLSRVEIWPPLVIGVNDSYLNDMRDSLLKEKEILNVFHDASSGKVEEGSVGIGLGLRAFGWKGGIGTSSRIFSVEDKKFSLGALVASNHGNKSDSKQAKGSLTLVLAVDVPLVPYQINQIARSIVVSLPPVNTLNNCQDSVSCFLFSTANAMSLKNNGPRVFNYSLVDDSALENIICAGAEAVREAILRSLLLSDSVQGRLGREVETIPDHEFQKILKQFEGIV